MPDTHSKRVLLLVGALVLAFGQARSGCIGRGWEKIGTKRGIDYYRKKNGQIVGAGVRLIVGLAEGKKIDRLLSRYALGMIKRWPHGIFLLEASSVEKMISICRQLQKDEAVRFAHPDWVKRIEPR